MSNQDNWPFIINLANSIIGVSVLATPFCFKQCGILLGTLLLIACGFLTRASCHILLKAAFLSRRRSYEFLALHLFGPTAKLLVEISTIGFLVGICIAFFVVIGDLGPHIISHLFGVKNTETLRLVLLVGIAVCVEFPLSMLRNIKSLSTLSALCVLFYVAFVFKVFLEAIPVMLNANWWLEVNWWRTAGVFRSLPILAMSFSCQTQLFVMYDVLPEPSPKKMNLIIAGAVNLCCLVYFCVAFFGYVAFYKMNITGDILVSFEATILSNVMKFCFLITIIISYPLSLFPCRESVHSLFFKQNIPHDLPGAIPASRFKMITSAIIIVSLIVAVLVPNVETILGLTGSTMGCSICFILPAVLFIRTQSKPNAERLMAQIVLCLGVFVLVASTYATLNSSNNSHDFDNIQNKLRADNFHAELSNKPIPNEGKAIKTETIVPRRQEPPNPNPPIQKKEIMDQAEGPRPMPPNLSLNKQDAVIIRSQKKKIETKKQEESKEEKHNDLIEKLQEQHREQLNIIEQQKQLLHELKQHHKEAHHEAKIEPVDLRPTNKPAPSKMEKSIVLNQEQGQKVANIVPHDQQDNLNIEQDPLKQQLAEKQSKEKIDLPIINQQNDQVLPNSVKIVKVEKRDMLVPQPGKDSPIPQMGNDKSQESPQQESVTSQPPGLPVQPLGDIQNLGLYNIPKDIIKQQEDMMAVNLQHLPVNPDDIPKELRDQEIAVREQFMAQQKILAQQRLLAQQREEIQEQNEKAEKNIEEFKALKKDDPPLNINLAVDSQQELNNMRNRPKSNPKSIHLSPDGNENKILNNVNVHVPKVREAHETANKQSELIKNEKIISEQKLLKDI